MSVRNRTFQEAFSRLPVYDILWEDADVDAEHLGLDTRSTVLAISAAGCGVASLLRAHPERIDTVDINRHHLALAALKMAAARRVRSYSSFYDLLGRGWHPAAEGVLREALADSPVWTQRYWAGRTDHFRSSMVGRWLTGRMLASLRRLSGIDATWLRAAAAAPVAERERAIDRALRPVLRNPLVAKGLASPLNLLALGINFQQRDRLLAAEQAADMGDVVLAHVKRVAATDLERNWFAWYAVAGHYNHDLPDAVPPYLRAASHEASREAPTRTSFTNGSILDVLDEAPAQTWSHYLLCDAPDWMPEPVQRRLFDGIRRTARPGATVLVRSVEREPLAERLGYDRTFVLDRVASERAAAADRTRQYRRVDFYRIDA